MNTSSLSSFHFYVPQLTAGDTVSVQAVANYLTSNDGRATQLPHVADTIQATWTAQILSNPVGTVRDTGNALQTSPGRMKADADRLTALILKFQQLLTANEAYAARVALLQNAIHSNQKIMLPNSIVFTPALDTDLGWLADEATYLDAANTIGKNFPAAVSDIQNNWTPPQNDTSSILALVDAKTNMFPQPGILGTLATFLRGTHLHLQQSVTTNQNLQNQVHALTAQMNSLVPGSVPVGGTTATTSTDSSVAPPGATDVPATPGTTPAAGSGSTAAWWLLGGLAVAGVGVLIFSKPKAPSASATLSSRRIK